MALLNIMDRKAIPDLLGKNYYIPEYQRGYRWDKKQVTDLLNDLLDFFNNKTSGQFYCLQPIVLKKIIIENTEWYEVIDGQQRLTTLRILMQVLDQLSSGFLVSSSHSYKIQYATRPELVDIFDTIKVIKSGSSIIIDDSQNIWNNLIDSLYIYNAATYILDWLICDQKRISIFTQYLYNDVTADKSVQVVWYETVEKNDPHDIFNRMNSLKVELSCSELIRSLFLSSTTEFQIDHDLDSFSDSVRKEIINERFSKKQSAINEKWDELEQFMRDKKFQSFITRRKITSRNSIELLFDIISGKYSTIKSKYNLNKEDKLYTYFFIKEMLDEDRDAWKTWEYILKSFEKLNFWYKDRVLYHRIGYLNAIADVKAQDNTICKLISENKNKSVISNDILDSIKNTLCLPNGIKKLSDLDYNEKNHYEYIKKILFLYNVETSCLQSNSEVFPFDRYRYDENGNEKTWTLEHIHAQNSDCLHEKKKDSWGAWIDDNNKALKKLSLGDPVLETDKNALISDLDTALKNYKKENYTFDNIRSLFDDVFNFYEKLDKTSASKPVHQLSNMALLDLGQNAMANNLPFEAKRQLICKKIAENDYYPICTQKVFLKMYDKDNIQIHSWGHKDRELYYDDIVSTIGKYFNNNSVF